MSGPPEMALFFGRLHPLLVHLPIGLILLLAVLELFARFPRFKHANVNAGLILALVIPATVVTVLCGWLLSLGGGYQARLLQIHKWMGIGTAAVCVLAGLLYWLDLKKAYRGCLFAGVAVLLVASHFGGSLTHGSDYLVRYAPPFIRSWFGAAPPAPQARPVAKARDVKTLLAYTDIVRPILQNDCVQCHGPEKSKGKLRLDTLDLALKGGDSGAAIVPGKPGKSELLKRLHLPPDDDDHMPPDGKPQPGTDDVRLLEWWIEAGAPGDKKLAELKPPAQVVRILEARFGPPRTLAKATPPKPLKEVLPLVASLGDAIRVIINPLAPNEPWLECNASMQGAHFDDAKLARLAALGPNIRWLDVGGTGISDAGLALLAKMPNLQRLHLERTAVGDAGIAHLASLNHLEYLDLYDTKVTDAGLETLQTLPRLKEVYLWETQVTPTAAASFIAARTDADQLQSWRQQIEQLQAQIREARITVDLGAALADSPATHAAAMNTQCPVSGKAIDPSKTVVYNGHVVAFCCDDCKAKFQKEPAAFLAKLGLSDSKRSTPAP